MPRHWVVALVVVIACKSKPDEPVKPPTGSAPVPGDARPDAAPPTMHHAYFDEAGRQGTCEFVKFEGKGKTRKTWFKLAPPPGKHVAQLQAWLFYYDKAGKLLDKYPHATPIDPGPQALGGQTIPAATDSVECELTRLTFDDSSFWFNGNLERNFDDRPRGGHPESELATHTGQRVLVEIVDAKAGKVKLTNTSDRPVKHLEVDVTPIFADGTHGWISGYPDVALKPGETVAVTLDYQAQTVPADAKTWEGTAPDVTFADDTEWFNHNLSGFYLPNQH